MSGKTLFALGLSRALRDKGLSVQPFKIGPHCTDARLFTLSGCDPAVNLDAWFCRPSELQALYNRWGEQAEVCVVEGDRALFDGFNCMKGSTADVAKMLGLPVLLVIDARYLTYSVAAVIYGYRHFRQGGNVIGVVFNRVTSEGQYAYLRQACLDAGVECLGYLPDEPEKWGGMPRGGVSRSVHAEWKARVRTVAAAVHQHVDVYKLLALATRIFPCPYSLPLMSDTSCDSFLPARRKGRLAVASDACFHAIHQDAFARWQAEGEVVLFSPMYTRSLPEADYYYLPGGPVERYAHPILRNRVLLEALHERARQGTPILAEGGAVILLCRQWQAREAGGPLPLVCSVDEQLNYGYRQTAVGQMALRGYESTCVRCKPAPDADSVLERQQVFDLTHTRPQYFLYRYKNVFASTVHWYWGKNDLFALWQ